MTTTDAKTQAMAGFEILKAFAEAIREAGPLGAPEGVMYAAVMSKMDIAQFERGMEILKNAGLIRRQNHVAFWVGGAE